MIKHVPLLSTCVINTNYLQIGFFSFYKELQIKGFNMWVK